MKTILITILILIGIFPVCAQEIRLSKDSLYYTLWSGYDTLMIYNVGTTKLVIDSIYTRSEMGYYLSIILKDNSFHFTFARACSSVYISMDPSDSALFILSRPFCSVCKSTIDFIDTITIRSNSVINSYSHISIAGEGMTNVESSSMPINGHMLFQNYHNPFNPITSIYFSLISEEFITFSIYNALGQRVSFLKLGKLEAGCHKVAWNGSNYPSGAYYYKIESNNFTAVKKMLLLK